ncbi:hypothetical protein HY490_00105 [Candidatus Woesearchaeota archaeon]|nr:hypothetical protein [Candidatus Woesearchaeota archaeon]
MDLDSFIRQQRALGHTRTAIRDYLLTQKFSPADIDAALRRQYPVHVPFFILAGVAIVVFSIIVAFYLWPAPEPVLDIRSQAGNTHIAAGDVLTFTTTLINPENVNADVDLLNELVLGNTLIGQKRVSVTMTKTQEYPQTFPVSSTVKPGKYVLRTTAYFDDTSAETELNITVLPAGTKAAPAVITPAPVLEEVGVVIPVEERPKKEAAKPALSRKPPAPILEEFTPGTDVKIDEIVRKRDRIGCEELTTTTDKDSCYATLARVLADTSLCQNIQRALLHDSCLAATGNTDCALYKAELNKEACFATR